jgi:HlyD family secretion protein
VATVTAEGTTRVKDLFVVAAPVDGELERIAVKAGDAVSRAAVIARIWPAAPRPLDSRSRAEALGAVSAARAALERTEAAEKEALGALTHAESQLATARTLSRAGAVAPRTSSMPGTRSRFASRPSRRVAPQSTWRARISFAPRPRRGDRPVRQVGH